MKRFLSIILCLTFSITCIAQTAVFGSPSENPADAEIAADSSFTKGLEVTYDYPIYPDANHMSDEEVFGVWSKEENAWQLKPKFDYSNWPGMADVENAAKEGDYTVAKDALLEYYRGVSKAGRNEYLYSSVVSKSVHDMSMLLARNFYASVYDTSKISNLFELDNEMKERRIDVTTTLTESIGVVRYRAFVIASIDQETTAEFLTKEGGFTPYLSLVVNGLNVEIPARTDTYISAGTNASVNFGSESTMLASEGITTEYVYSDEDTKRVLLQFDISSLSKGDNISNATLVLKGYNASGTGIKEMLLYQWAEENFDEDTVSWNTFPESWMFSCNSMDSWDYVTSSSTTIKGKSCFFHRGNILSNPASAYSISGNEEYAHIFIRQQMALQYYLGFNLDVMNELDMSTHLSSTVTSVFRVIDSKYMTGERFTAMFKHLWTISRWICEDYYGTRNNNYATFATAGGYKFISYFKEIGDYDLWLANTQYENERVQSNFVREDGTSVELARHYQATLLSTLHTPLDTQISLGNEDSPFTDYTIDCIHRLMHDFVYSSSPGWLGWDLGDGNDVYKDFSSTYKNFYTKLFSDDKLLEYVVTNGVSGEPPEQTSMSFPYGLRTYLRSDWGNKADALVITAKGEVDSSHGDSDLLSIVMHAHGQYLLVDAGYGSGLTGGVYIYMGSAQQHNTVTVNGLDHVNDNKGHAATEGKELEVELNDIYDFVTYAADQAITTADKFRRSVAFMRDAGFWIVSDYIEQDGSEYNDYSQHWAMLPSANISVDEETKIARSNFNGVNVQVVPVAPEDYTYVQLENTTYSPATSTYIDNKKVAYHQNTNSTEIVYTTVLVPEDLDEDIEVKTHRLSTGLSNTDANCARISVTDHAKGTERIFYYYHLNDNDKQQTVSVGKYSTDATTMMLEEGSDGSIVSAMLLNATFLSANNLRDKYIFKSKNQLKSIAFRSNGSLIDVDSSILTTEELLHTTFYDFDRYNDVLFDDENMEAKYKNGYLYFGEEPIVEGTPDEEDNPSGGGSSGGASSGGTSGGIGSVTGVGHAGGDVAASVPAEPSKPETDDAIKAELEGHWAENEILKLYNDGIVKGDSQGLRLKDNISRAEFVALLVRALDIETTENTIEFSDVSETDWFADYVLAASSNGIVNGSDGVFRPNDTVTREEMSKILVAASEYMNLTAEESELSFIDVENISEWARSYVAEAVALGLMNGMDDGSFNPKGNALREQAFAVISRIMSLSE